MWYRYAKLKGIHDFTRGLKRRIKKYQTTEKLLPPLHDNCRCRIVKKGNTYEWLIEVDPCNQCLLARNRFNLEQIELAKARLVNPTPEIVAPIIEPTPEIKQPEIIEPIEEEIIPEIPENQDKDIVEEPLDGEDVSENNDVQPLRHHKRRRLI